MYKNVLIILPHPDDEAFGMAGSIAKYIEEGAHVTYTCLTLGEMGRNLGSPFFTNREELPSIRKKELKDACAALGIQSLKMLGYRDKTIEFEPMDTLSAHLLEVINEVKPDLIMTFYPGYSVHPDHDATGAAVMEAVRQLPENERPVIHCVAFAWNTERDLGKPQIKLDVTPYLDKKLDAIRAHRSQTEGMMKLFDKKQEDDSKKSYDIKKERFWIYKI